MSKHYLIFIHGIGELKNGETLAPGYDALWHLLIKNSGMDEQEFNKKFGRIDIVWHTNLLRQAANTIFNSAFPNLRRQWWNPMHGIRKFMTFFLGDAIAYVSEDVNLIRRTVWQQIWDYTDQANGLVFKQLLEGGATYSIVAHSLGTTIAFDYLFELFEENKLFVPLPEPEARPEDSDLKAFSVNQEEITLLQNQFRHFFSMGSPIGLFLLRKGALWMQDNEGPFAKVRNPIRRNGRVWCNFWDSNDAIAYPVAKLFDNDCNIECKLLDIPVETGGIIRSHLRYWKNQKVAAEIEHFIRDEA